jgi:hypothetical protein
MEDGSWDVDENHRCLPGGLQQLGMYEPDNPKIVTTMQAIQWQPVKTNVGGVARYTGDHYHQVSQDSKNVPGIHGSSARCGWQNGMR